MTLKEYYDTCDKIRKEVLVSEIDDTSSIFEIILTKYFERGEEELTIKEKEIIKAALVNYEIAIKDSLTQEEHTQEEVAAAFDAWNLTTKLIKKYSK